MKGRRLSAWMLAASAMLGTGQVPAMTFTIVRAVDGTHGVSARGEIVPGDARRLKLALAMADEDALGSRHLLLDSPGGSVSESLAMIPVMDRMKVTTEVLSGAVCASSCSAIVFVSGFRRFMQHGGLLGFHTCFRRASGLPLPLCNDAIADNAEAHGVSWGTVIVFQRAAGPSGMAWVGKEEAECWGLADPRQRAGLPPGRPYVPPCVEMLQ
jgi:membrane-bound ClpP family serine protease